ncbi:MAG: transketolase [Actinobacteria bacterium]|nr:transketolase [Actinomycetota bacterium]
MNGNAELRRRAHAIRRTVIEMCRGRGQGYAGQGLGLADLMAVLYFSELGEDDHFVLSTGHSSIAVFAALHERGDYELEELVTYGMDGSRIEESPLEGTPGFEITGGSLGQGLSQAVGLALGERLRGGGSRVYCLVSDGELQEGQVWEACMAAAHHRLDNLVLLVDNNRMQADGAVAEILEVEPVPERLTAFGFAARRIDANTLADVVDAFAWARGQRGRPTALVCDNIPGKGVPSFEERQRVHYVRAPDQDWAAALVELDETEVAW